MSPIMQNGPTTTLFDDPARLEMASFTNNNGAFETPFGRGDDRQRPGYYTSASQQQNVPEIGNFSSSDLHWPGGSLRESYVPTSNVPDTNSWRGVAFPDLSVYGGSVWLGDSHHDEARLGSPFGVPRGSADRSGVNLMAMEVAAPVSEQAFPAAPSTLSTFQPPPPSLNWPPAPEPLWQPPSPWAYPVRTARPHNGHNSSTGSLAMRPGNSSSRLATSSVIAGYSERRFMPTGSLPSITTSNSVQPSTSSDPVPVASLRPRGERWEHPSEPVFQCQWAGQCGALMAGNRRSVTNHFRDKHDFICDDQHIACTWDDCSTSMQRRNIPRHIVTCHFAVKVTCPRCGLALSRADANKKHLLACTGASDTLAVVQAMGGDESGYSQRS